MIGFLGGVIFVLVIASFAVNILFWKTLRTLKKEQTVQREALARLAMIVAAHLKILEGISGRSSPPPKHIDHNVTRILN
jgi:hypothetical protein